MIQYLQEIFTLFKRKTLNESGIEADLYKKLQAKDIDGALSLFQDRTEDVDNALKEYNPQTHRIMNKPNKPRKGQRPYITEKLPRTRQRYINEVELFFIFGSPLRFTKSEGTEEAFKLFTDFVKANHFDSRMREAKRLAGAETECAKLYHLYNDEGEIGVKSVILARSTGYELRPLFNQYGDLVAFAYGFKTKDGNGKAVQHWTFETRDSIFDCVRSETGWQVAARQNPTRKINVIYYKQPKAWDGAEMRIEREEALISNIADTNNYFADPVAKASADVIKSLASPETTGKLIQMNGGNSVFEYVNPPQSSELRRSEQENLEKSILFDTFTPDFSFENMRGLGSVSGVAIKNAMILGFLKADNRKEIYSELITRDINLIKSILAYQHPDKARELSELQVGFEYSAPFAEDDQSSKQFILSVYQGGLITLETAVRLLALTDAPENEIRELQAKAEAPKPQDGDEKRN